MENRRKIVTENRYGILNSLSGICEDDFSDEVLNRIIDFGSRIVWDNIVHSITRPISSNSRDTV